MSNEELQQLEDEVSAAFSDFSYSCYMEITTKEERRAAYERYVELRNRLQEARKAAGDS